MVHTHKSKCHRLFNNYGDRLCRVIGCNYSKKLVYVGSIYICRTHYIDLTNNIILKYKKEDNTEIDPSLNLFYRLTSIKDKPAMFRTFNQNGEKLCEAVSCYETTFYKCHGGFFCYYHKHELDHISRNYNQNLTNAREILCAIGTEIKKIYLCKLIKSKQIDQIIFLICMIYQHIESHKISNGCLSKLLFIDDIINIKICDLNEQSQLTITHILQMEKIQLNNLIKIFPFAKLSDIIDVHKLK